MEIRFIPDGTMTGQQQKDVDIINYTCLSGPPDDAEGPAKEFNINTYGYSAPEHGMFLLYNGERVVGRVAVHKVLTDYNGQEYYLGGFGGLAVLPEFQGNGYGRKLTEAALTKACDIGVDVACMEVNTESGIVAFYSKLGFRFLNRPAYYINHGNNEATDDNIMIMGLNNISLAEEILNTKHKFHYGKILGHW